MCWECWGLHGTSECLDEQSSINSSIRNRMEFDEPKGLQHSRIQSTRKFWGYANLTCCTSHVFYLYNILPGPVSWDSAVCTVTELWAGRFSLRFPAGVRELPPQPSKLALRATKLLTQRCGGGSFPEIRQPGREADHTPSFSAWLRMNGTVPPFPTSLVFLHDVRRDNLTFTFTFILSCTAVTRHKRVFKLSCWRGMELCLCWKTGANCISDHSRWQSAWISC